MAVTFGWNTHGEPRPESPRKLKYIGGVIGHPMASSEASAKRAGPAQPAARIGSPLSPAASHSEPSAVRWCAQGGKISVFGRRTAPPVFTWCKLRTLDGQVTRPGTSRTGELSRDSSAESGNLFSPRVAPMVPERAACWLTGNDGVTNLVATRFEPCSESVTSSVPGSFGHQHPRLRISRPQDPGQTRTGPCRHLASPGANHPSSTY